MGKQSYQQDKRNRTPNYNEEIKRKVASLVKDFLNGSYQTKAEIIREKLQKEIVEAMKNEGKNKPSKHQIRRYYHYLLEISEGFSESAAMKIALAKAYINYDANRNQIKSRYFKAFIEEIVDSILSEKDSKKILSKLKDCLVLFEALVGYTADF